MFYWPQWLSMSVLFLGWNWFLWHSWLIAWPRNLKASACQESFEGKCLSVHQDRRNCARVIMTTRDGAKCQLTNTNMLVKTIGRRAAFKSSLWQAHCLQMSVKILSVGPVVGFRNLIKNCNESHHYQPISGMAAAAGTLPSNRPVWT